MCRILLADNHIATREALRDVLTSYGDMQIIAEAADGEEAVAMVATSRPDVILLDLNMPRMNGIQAASLIKQSWKDAVIIGLCAFQDAYTMGAFVKAGALTAIPKDRFEYLHSTVKRACRHKPRVFE
jgi:DNA-binding NarL/FixJ family response regulator